MQLGLHTNELMKGLGRKHHLFHRFCFLESKRIPCFSRSTIFTLPLSKATDKADVSSKTSVTVPLCLVQESKYSTKKTSKEYQKLPQRFIDILKDAKLGPKKCKYHILYRIIQLTNNSRGKAGGKLTRSCWTADELQPSFPLHLFPTFEVSN